MSLVIGKMQRNELKCIVVPSSWSCRQRFTELLHFRALTACRFDSFRDIDSSMQIGCDALKVLFDAPACRHCMCPMRIPPGLKADLSPGTVFLSNAMHASSNTRSARAPSIPLAFKFTSIRWLSVPPDTHLYPDTINAATSVEAFHRACSWYFTKSGALAILSATASTAIVWLWVHLAIQGTRPNGFSFHSRTL